MTCLLHRLHVQNCNARRVFPGSLATVATHLPRKPCPCNTTKCQRAQPAQAMEAGSTTHVSCLQSFPSQVGAGSLGPLARLPQLQALSLTLHLQRFGSEHRALAATLPRLQVRAPADGGLASRVSSGGRLGHCTAAHSLDCALALARQRFEHLPRSRVWCSAPDGDVVPPCSSCLGRCWRRTLMHEVARHQTCIRVRTQNPSSTCLC
jgi:predicted component of type VI protein secretion system